MSKSIYIHTINGDCQQMSQATNELREAAERYRARRALVIPSDIYDDPPPECVDWDGWYAAREREDLERLADAYLAEHPAGDESPVTIEWMREVGLCDRRTVLDVFFEQEGCACRWHGWEVAMVKTRGDLRKLAAALGIELKGA
jgi:hypothetical protein